MCANLESFCRYAVLFGGGPRVKNDNGDDVAQEPGFLRYFQLRITHLLRREYLAKSEQILLLSSKRS